MSTAKMQDKTGEMAQRLRMHTPFHHCDKDYNQRQTWGGKVVSAYNSQVILHLREAKAENLEAETEAEAIETQCFLDCSLSFLKYPRTTCPGAAQPTHAGPFYIN